MQAIRLEFQRGSVKDFVEVVINKEYAEKAKTDTEFATSIIQAVLDHRSGNKNAAPPKSKLEHPRGEHTKPTIQVKLNPGNRDKCDSIRKVDVEKNKQDVPSKEIEVIVLDSDSNSGDETRNTDTGAGKTCLSSKQPDPKASVQDEDSQSRPRCMVNSENHPDLVFFSFSANAVIRKKWSNAMGLGSVKRLKIIRWADQATHAFLDILIAMLTKGRHQLTMESFREASLEMKKKGFQKSLQDCRLKLKSLKKTHARVLFNKKQNKAARWEFQMKMEILMHKLGAAKIAALQSEDAEIPENCQGSSFHSAEDPHVEEANERIPKPPAKPKWCDKSVEHLLSLYSTMANESSNGRLGSSVWEDIARMMTRNGFRSTASQCSSKTQDLMRIYEDLVKRLSVGPLPHVEQVMYEKLSAVFATNPICLSSSSNHVEIQQNDVEIQRSDNFEIYGSNFEIQGGEVKWSDKSVTYLLRLYSTKTDHLINGRLAACAWEDIARIMTRSGFSVTASQCSSKAEDLMRIYKEISKRRTTQKLPHHEQVLYEQLGPVFGKNPIYVDCLKNASSIRKFEVKGATFEEQMKSYLTKRLAQREEHERARRLHHREQLEVKRELIGAFREFLKHH